MMRPVCLMLLIGSGVLLMPGCGEQKIQTPQLPRTVIFFHETETLSEVPLVTLPPEGCMVFESSDDGIKIYEVRDEEDGVVDEPMPFMMLVGEPTLDEFRFSSGGNIYHTPSSIFYKKAPGHWKGIFRDWENDYFENVFWVPFYCKEFSIKYRLRYRQNGKVTLGPEMILKSYAVD